MNRTLVVAATRAEATHVPAGLEVVLTGLGKTAAAVATTRALLTGTPSDTTVVNIGTAGALRQGLAGLFEVGAVLNHDMNADAVRALGFDPEEYLRIGSSETVLASGDLFVTDAAVRDVLAERAHLVDMEGYAVAFACRALGARIRMVKHVSDAADESALDWPAVVDRSAQALGEWLAANVAGAAGGAA